MSTHTAVPRGAALEDAGGEETLPIYLWLGIGCGALGALFVLLCLGAFFLGSVAAGHPISDILLTPVP